jgi:hypothetical protein
LFDPYLAIRNPRGTTLQMVIQKKTPTLKLIKIIWWPKGITRLLKNIGMTTTACPI